MAKKPTARKAQGHKVHDPRPSAALVKMVRDSDAYPEPHTADVHPDEVENWLATGFRPVEE